jgi:hypothetical protein
VLITFGVIQMFIVIIVLIVVILIGHPLLYEFEIQ